MDYHATFLDAVNRFIEDYQAGRLDLRTAADMQSYLFFYCVSILSEQDVGSPFALHCDAAPFDPRERVDMLLGDVMIGHDTVCSTTLDKNQWIGQAAGKAVVLPVVADCQFAALACGAHPYKIAQLHWHASGVETLMARMGIDWEKARAEFEAYLKQVEAGKGETLYDPRLMVTSGPGFRQAAE